MTCMFWEGFMEEEDNIEPVFSRQGGQPEYTSWAGHMHTILYEQQTDRWDLEKHGEN